MGNKKKDPRLVALSEAIQARLDAIGRAAEDVSIKAGYGKDGIRDIYRGSEPSVFKLEDIANEMGCTAAHLLGHTRDPEGRQDPAVNPSLTGPTGQSRGGEAAPPTNGNPNMSDARLRLLEDLAGWPDQHVNEARNLIKRLGAALSPASAIANPQKRRNRK